MVVCASVPSFLLASRRGRCSVWNTSAAPAAAPPCSEAGWEPMSMCLRAMSPGSSRRLQHIDAGRLRGPVSARLTGGKLACHVFASKIGHLWWRHHQGMPAFGTLNSRGLGVAGRCQLYIAKAVPQLTISSQPAVLQGHGLGQAPGTFTKEKMASALAVHSARRSADSSLDAIMPCWSIICGLRVTSEETSVATRVLQAAMTAL